MVGRAPDDENGAVDDTFPGGDDGSGATSLALFPLGTVLYPGMPLPLHLFEERYRRLMEDHHRDDPIFGVVLTRQGREVSDEPETHEVGTAASLLGVRQYPDGRYDVAVRGGRRFRILGGDWSRGYLTGRVVFLDEPDGEPEALGDLAQQTVAAYRAFLSLLSRAVGADVPDERLDEAPTPLSYAIAARLPLNTWERQRLLEAPSTADRLLQLTTILTRERRLLTEAGAAGAAIEQPGRRFTAN